LLATSRMRGIFRRKTCGLNHNPSRDAWAPCNLDQAYLPRSRISKSCVPWLSSLISTDACFRRERRELSIFLGADIRVRCCVSSRSRACPRQIEASSCGDPADAVLPLSGFNFYHYERPSFSTYQAVGNPVRNANFVAASRTGAAPLLAPLASRTRRAGGIRNGRNFHARQALLLARTMCRPRLPFTTDNCETPVKSAHGR